MKLRHAVAAASLAALLGSTAIALAQFSGQIPNNTVLGNVSGGTAPARPVALTSGLGANPTAQIGASAINGTANTFLRSDGAPALADSGVSAGTYTKITVDAKGRATVGATAACADLSDEGAGCTASAANPTATASGAAINGVATTYMRSDAAPAIAFTQRLAIGWDPALDPATNVIATIDAASTLVSLVGTVVVPVGAAATLSVHKAASGVACSAGTVLHSGTFDANGTAVTNQTLTITVTALSAGDRLCLVTSDSANWTAGAGVGGITARITTP